MNLVFYPYLPIYLSILTKTMPPFTHSETAMVGMNQNFLEPSTKLLAAEVDSLAKSDPGRRFGLIPKSNRIEDGFREITFLDLSRAVNATSWWIEKYIGRPIKGETIAYMGNNDVRYILFMLASHKLGYTVSSSYTVSVDY